MTNALKIGSARMILLSLNRSPLKILPPYKKSSPTAVNVAARPKLKATVRISP